MGNTGTNEKRLRRKRRIESKKLKARKTIDRLEKFGLVCAFVWKNAPEHVRAPHLYLVIHNVMREFYIFAQAKKNANTT